ncbi:hypothetical protein Q3G72_003393 [Acer saccharum]|nr:hypothetical protein Q3G72_003393 [Acer saccharum]
MGADSEEDMMHDTKEGPPEVDLEAIPLISKSRIQLLAARKCLSPGTRRKRQLDLSVELAASKGDVRLACLLSQAGGSMMSCYDVARQLNLWKVNVLDFNFIEKDRIRLYELLAGNIHSSSRDVTIDWKRFLGLLMWYQLPPDTSLPAVFRTYQDLLDNGKAPLPVAIYIDEDL